MDKRLEKKLKDKYPELCRNCDKSIYESCMGWGFEHGDGWYQLVDELFEKLSNFKVVRLAQVKEKFGMLRVYIDGVDHSISAKVYDTISEYEEKSGKICETCGEEGKMRGGHWIYTACDKCDEKYQEGKRAWKTPQDFPNIYEKLFGKDKDNDAMG